jgi:hypothetical protein
MSDQVKDAFLIIAIIILIVVFVYLIMLSGATKPYDDEPLTDKQKMYIKLFLDRQCTDGYLMTKLGIFEWKDAQALIERYEKEGKNE